MPICLHANTIVEVYGTGIEKSELILKKYTKDVITIGLNIRREFEKNFRLILLAIKDILIV